MPYRPPEPGAAIELLILGGSQGARIFADIVPPALAALPQSLRRPLRVSQQARPEDCERVAAQLQAAAVAAEVSSFFSDVPKRLSQAQLVICRSGASTIAELAGMVGAQQNAARPELPRWPLAAAPVLLRAALQRPAFALLDVLAPADTTVVACFGDSITDGTASTLNGDDRWPDVLSRRLHAAYGSRLSVVNSGIGGNRVIGPPV